MNQGQSSCSSVSRFAKERTGFCGVSLVSTMISYKERARQAYLAGGLERRLLRVAG
jgi:hypothetical protein